MFGPPSLSPSNAINLYGAWLYLGSDQQTLAKWLAVLLMLLDHANRTLWSFQPWLFTLSRLAFPLFAFLMAYNFAVRGVSARRYWRPLLIFGFA